jgi:hypothetical protein
VGQRVEAFAFGDDGALDSDCHGWE